MPKNLFQDMVKVKRERQEEARRASMPPSERSVLEREAREAEVLESRREQRSGHEEEIETESPRRTKKEKGGRKHALWVVALASVGVFIFALSFFFAKAEVTVSPQVKDLALNQNLGAVKGSSGETLSFDMVVISDEETKTVLATSQKDISQAAEGTVVIYNNFSAASQALNIDTRLEGSNGKIYKTKTKTTVPGIKGGKPGSVEVKIYGSAPGTEYNSGPLDFTIVGFKGTSKYSKFYARSKGNITGGLKGKFYTIGEAEKTNVVNELKTLLQEKLFQKATDQIPAGFILPKDAVFLSIDAEGANAYSPESNIPVKLKGTLNGILFEEKKLTREIAKKNIPNYDGSEVYLPNIRDLKFSLASDTNLSNIANLSTISFNLSGETKLIWKVDDNKLTSDLLGKSKKSFGEILAQYPNINSANVVLNPFWNRSFPSKSEKIKVIVNYPN